MPSSNLRWAVETIGSCALRGHGCCVQRASHQRQTGPWGRAISHYRKPTVAVPMASKTRASDPESVSGANPYWRLAPSHDLLLDTSGTRGCIPVNSTVLD